MAEKFNAKSGKRFKGAVLMMVLTVMFVLLIMLLATLTVVSTAKSRTYGTFEENQAYFTARSTLDVFAQNILTKGSGDCYEAYDTSGSVRYYEYTDESGVDHTTDSPMTQAAAIQYDIYQLRSLEDTTGERYKSDLRENIKQNNIRANLVEDDYDAAVTNAVHTELLQDQYVYSTEYTDPLAAGDSDKGLGKDYLLYFAKLPDTASDSDKYGIMADEGNVEIKVEVLDREYNLGGAYGSGIQAAVDAKLATGNAADRTDVENFYKGISDITAADGVTTYGKDELVDAICCGDRSMDAVRLKITSTVEYLGVKGTAILICDNFPEKSSTGDDTGALTTRSDLSADNLNIIGGIVTGNPINWKNNQVIYEHGKYGNVSADWTHTTPPVIHTLKGAGYIIDGNYSANNGVKWETDGINPGDTVSISDRPYVYIAGDFNVTNSVDVTPMGNTPEDKIDMLLGGNFKWGLSANIFKYNGDIYCKGDFDISACSSTSIQIDGNVYVGGDLILPTSTSTSCYYDTSGPVINISGITGKIYVTDASKVKYNNSSLTADAGAVANAVTAGTMVVQSMDFSSFPAQGVLSTAHSEIEISLAMAGDSTAKKTVPELYDITSYDSAEVQSGIVAMGYTDFNDVADDAVCTISGNGSTSLSTYTGGYHVYDTDSIGGGSIYVMEDLNNAKIKLEGTGTIYVVLRQKVYPWGVSFISNNNEILIEDSLTVKFLLPYAAATYEFENIKIWSESIANAYNSSSSVYVGNGEHAIANKPKVYYYLSQNVKIMPRNNDTFLWGYIYGPEAIITDATSQNTFKLTYCVNVTLSDGTTEHVDIPVKNHNNGDGIYITFMGSVDVKEFHAGSEKGGIAYIFDAGDGGGPKGFAPWNIQVHEYTRT